MDEEADPRDDERPFGSEWIDGFIAMLDQRGTSMIPWPVRLSDEDSEALASARKTALRELAAQGWVPILPELHERLREWFLVRFQRAQFRAMYFGGWSSRPADRIQGLEALEDFALAILVHEYVDESVYDRLVGRCEVGTLSHWSRPEKP